MNNQYEFKPLSKDELMDIDGGLIVSGFFIAACAVGIVVGAAVGYYNGKKDTDTQY